MSTPSQQPSPGPKHFYSLPEVANRYDVSVRTVRRWIKNGELVAHRIGRQLRISAEDLRTFEKLRRGV